MAKPIYVPSQEIPEDRPLSSEEAQLGQHLYTNFNDKYSLSDDHERIAQLERLVGHLAEAAGAGDSHWQIHLLDAPEIVDIRAVAGNRIFVWSGVYEVIANEDELAGLLALEIAHDLARHTDPVRFNMMSDLLFKLGSLAGSTALMIASQGAVNVGGLDWMKLVYIEARDLRPEERYYSEAEERRAASIALHILRRSDCRPEAVLEFFWRSLEGQLKKGAFERLHRRLSPDQRLDLLEGLIAGLQTQQAVERLDANGDLIDIGNSPQRLSPPATNDQPPMD
jgi:predicted Zn-dependent protease